MNGVVLSISQLNRYVKSIIEQDRNLQTVFVCGEISNFTNHYNTGHYYFTLKDDSSSIKAVMFKGANEHLRFLPENNMSVIVRGRVGVFERDGVYQLYVDDMQPDGSGALSVAFEQLKKKLEAEGLFAAERKKPLPQYPMRIGVVTSPTGAAVRDIINILSRRFPLATVVMCPVLVQGAEAAGQIAGAINSINKVKGADVLIVGRGGGSAEDLWAFNEEIVARAVAASDIPVISAVGHETDFTICDFVADLRAPTPSAAAEIAVPDMLDEREKLYSARSRMRAIVASSLHAYDMRLSLFNSKLTAAGTANYIANLRVRCDMAVMAIENLTAASLSARRSFFCEQCARLEALSPLKIIARGYSVAIKNGKIVSSARDISCGDELKIKISDADVKCTVTDINNFRRNGHSYE